MKITKRINTCFKTVKYGGEEFRIPEDHCYMAIDSDNHLYSYNVKPTSCGFSEGWVMHESKEGINSFLVAVVEIEGVIEWHETLLRVD